MKLYLEMGTSSKLKIYDVSSNSIEDNIILVLPAVHALCGCDSTSCFNGMGKTKLLSVLQDNDRFIDAANLLGEQEDLSTLVKEELEECVCRLYGIQNEVSINEARYKLFTRSKKIPDPQKLPPTKDALYLHFDRVNYQCNEWQHALESSREVADSIGNGWIVNESKEIEIDWQREKPAPEALL